MKDPKSSSRNERFLDQFVIAADTDSLDAACDLLFIHGNDLTWGRNERGLFLAGVETDESFEEVVQVVEARSKIHFTSLLALFLRQFEPKMIEFVADIAPKLEEEGDDEQKEEIINSAIASLVSKKNLSQIDKVLPEIFGVEQWLMVADAITSSLVRSAVSLRRRQLAATGMSEDQYNYMLYALRRLTLCAQIVRIAYPEDTFDFETSLTSRGGFKATEVARDAKLVEILRLHPSIAALKRGQDNALALFISDYINRHYTGTRAAFACARYGDQNAPELDVIVPALNLGFEVKLYQAPFAQTENKLERMAHDLRKQLPAYYESGCQFVYYVTNLSPEMAKTVLEMVQGGQALNIEVLAEGMGSLIPVLNTIGQALAQLQASILEQRVKQQNTSSKKAGKKKKR